MIFFQGARFFFCFRDFFECNVAQKPKYQLLMSRMFELFILGCANYGCQGMNPLKLEGLENLETAYFLWAELF